MSSFEKSYFTGKGKTQNYKDYRNKKYNELAIDLIRSVWIEENDKLIDYGCATGALMWQFKRKGYKIKGTDISMWAVDWGREHYNLSEDILQHYNRQLLNEPKDWVLALDILEHLPDNELDFALDKLRMNCKKGIVVRIPVSKEEGEDFVLDVSKNDRTHIQIHCKEWWTGKLLSHGFFFSHLLDEKTIYDSEGVFCAVFKVEK